MDKALYGLKQSPQAWFTKLSTSLLQHGFVASQAYTSMFIYSIGSIFLVVLICVKDIIVITGNNLSGITNLISFLSSHFAIKAVGTLHYLLGVEVHQTATSLHLNQAKYISDLLT